MAQYLIQLSYTPQAWATLLENPQNRAAAIEPATKKLGGVIDNWWLTFGKYDIAVVLSMPDETSVAAFAMAVSAGGAVDKLHTTPLFSVEQEMEAIRRASDVGYEPPW